MTQSVPTQCRRGSRPTFLLVTLVLPTLSIVYSVCTYTYDALYIIIIVMRAAGRRASERRTVTVKGSEQKKKCSREINKLTVKMQRELRLSVKDRGVSAGRFPGRKATQ